MKKLCMKIAILLPVILLFNVASLSLMPVVPVSAAPIAAPRDDPCADTSSSKGQVLLGAGETSAGSCSGAGVSNIVGSVVSILSIVVGVAAVIMIILSGFRYITSGGDSNKVASAKSSLIYALVGLAVAALAQVIVHDVLHSAVKAAGLIMGITHVVP
jgi:hypothetical protein